MNEETTIKNREAHEAAEKLANYEWGFSSDIEQEFAPKGLNEDTVRFISAKKNEPEWMLEWRLKAYRAWLEMEEVELGQARPAARSITRTLIITPSPRRSRSSAASTRSIPKSCASTKSSASRSRSRRCSPASRARARSRSTRCSTASRVATTFREELKRAGVIFLLDLAKRSASIPSSSANISARVVPQRDNYFACLNAAVFSDGTFVYIPEGVRCPMELSTYFRINAENTGQFERTLIVADKGSYVSYLEGCTAPMRDENQLHAAVVEIFAHEDAEVKYSTVQNWYPGDAEGKGGIFNFVTKRALCSGARSKVSWTQVETGSAITWKYPSCILKGEGSVGEFYSVALTNNRQQADTGTKMVHIGANTRSTIVSKGISAGRSDNTYRGLVRVLPGAENVRNFTQCDSAAARRPMRRAHRALHRGQEPDRADRA